MRALLLLFVILFVNTTFSQNYRFNEFGIENGISQNFIYSIEQDAKGYLWVGTGEGLCRYNGREFSTFTKSDGIAEDIVTSSFINKNQEKWFGHNGGQLTLRKNGKFKIYKNSSIISTITGIDGIEEEMLFISQNEGVFSLKNDQITSIGKFGATSFHSIKFIDQTNAAIGTSTGLIHLGKRNGKWKKNWTLFVRSIYYSNQQREIKSFSFYWNTRRTSYATKTIQRQTNFTSMEY